MAKTLPTEFPILPFATQDDLEAWFDEHHETADGLWLKYAKKASGIQSVTYPESVDVALCFGWIDSQKRSFDVDYALQRFTPRRRRSKWSKNNCEKATRFIQEGRMRPAGFREVERAREDGRWDRAYDPPSKMSVPADLQRALSAEATAFFESLDATNRYAVLFRIQTDVRDDTRRRRIAQFVEMLERKEKIYE